MKGFLTKKKVIVINWTLVYKCATLDVAALYSNIPAVCNYLVGDNSMLEGQKHFILDGIEFILKRNVFSFNGQLYIQTNGTAMGTRFAPSFVNLYTGEFEGNFMCRHPWRSNIITFKCNIDNLLNHPIQHW